MSASSEPNPEAIAALLTTVERVVDDERSRGAALTSKATTLAGFSGTILSIVSVLGRDALKLDVGSIERVAIAGLFTVGVIALASASTLAIWGVLRTKIRLLIDTEQVLAFAKPPWIYVNAIEIEGNRLASLGQALTEERRVNDRKAEMADRASLALLIGVLALASQAIIVALATPAI
jgi:hypothetical protein